MHDEVGVRQAAVDFLDHIHGEDGPVGLARELVGAVAGAHRDGQRIDLCRAHEIDGLIRVSQKLRVIELAFGAMAVFGFAHSGFQRTKHAELAFDRDAAGVRHLDDFAGHGDIVVVVGRGLRIFLERAVHHHRGKAELDGGRAGGGAVAVILVHADRDVRVEFGAGIDDVLQHDIVGVGTGAARGLHDDGGVDLVGRLHDGERLFHVVDVEGRQAIAVLGCVIEQLPQRDTRHLTSPGTCLLPCGGTAEFGQLSPSKPDASACKYVVIGYKPALRP